MLCMERKLHDPASKEEIESVEKPLSVPLLQYMVVDVGGKCVVYQWLSLEHSGTEI